MRMKLKMQNEPRSFSGTIRSKMFDDYIGVLIERFPISQNPIEWEEFARNLTRLAKSIELAAISAAIAGAKKDD